MKPKITAEALFQRIQAAWDHARKGHALPRRHDIDAVKIGALLPYVGLIDVIHGERIDLRYRLVGAQTTQSFGFNLTGHLHSKLSDPTMPTKFYDTCVRCVRTAAIQSLEIENGRNRKDLPFQVRARIWPLSDDGQTVTGLLGGAMFETPSPGELEARKS
jgi:hypothetical protein